MTTEECKGYACPPSTTVDLPECEHGWEIGNGTAVCATQQPAPTNLAATGGSVDVAGVVLGSVLLVLGLWYTIGWALIRRAERRIPAEAAEAQQEGLAELDTMLARGGSSVGRKLDHDLGER